MDLRPGMTVNIVTILTVAADRPDNTWLGLGSELTPCSALSLGYACTAQKGHTGDHMAYGASGNVCHTWPAAGVSNEFEPSARLRCNDEDNLNGYICTARAGHDGPHMGWYGPGERSGDATW
jgi:hypothetical protein